MALSIVTNVAALTSQRALAKNGSTLGTSFQRLSTGLRINSAKDDAAGLAISERLTAQIRGLNQGIRNANDGVSLVQTAEAALNESTNLLQRIRELAVQSANDTNTASDRRLIQTEVDQLVSELDRIAEETSFNGKLLLDGTFTSAVFQVGANAGQTITVTVGDQRTSVLGATAVVSGAAITTATAISAGTLSINGVTIRATTAADDTFSSTSQDGSAIAKARAINDAAGATGVTATVNGTAETGAGAVAVGSSELVINGVSIGVVATVANDADSALRTSINAYSGQTGVTASLNTSFEIVLSAADGRNIVITAGAAGFGGSGLSAGTSLGSLTLESDASIGIGGTNAGIAGLAAGTTAVSFAQNIGNADLTSQAGATAALARVDSALRQVTTLRSTLGAQAVRLESTIVSQTAVSENLQAARSRIQDADIASETTMLIRNQILQQAATAMLAQANIAPQIALSLLGGQ